MRRQVSYCGNDYEVELYKSGRTEKIFDVYLLRGYWITDAQVVNMADGGNPAHYSGLHNGGTVRTGDNENHRIVTVRR